MRYGLEDDICVECVGCEININNTCRCLKCFDGYYLDDNQICQEEKDLYSLIKNKYIPLYNGSEPIIFKADNNFIFQMTTVDNELEALNGNTTSNLSIVDISKCTDLIKGERGLDPDTDLILLKYENESITSNGEGKSVQYEVYLPGTNEKIDLSFCSKTNIDIYLPIQLTEETQKLYDELNDKGYNLFDKKDKFYNDICTQYKSKDGTDMLLSDRLNDVYNENELICQANCNYGDYLGNSKYLKCVCDVINNEKIEVKQPEIVTSKNIGKTFYNILKYSNYKVVMCYKLVLRKTTIFKNYGSIFVLIYFIGYLISFFMFCYRKLAYLKEEIGKLMETKNNKRRQSVNLKKDKIIIFNQNNIYHEDFGNSEDKEINKKDSSKSYKKDEKHNDKNDKKKKKERRKSKTKFFPPKKHGSNNDIIRNNNKRKSKSRYRSFRINNNNLRRSSSKERLSLINNLTNRKYSSNSIQVFNPKKYNNGDRNTKKSKSSRIKNIIKKEALSDYELNDLEYIAALEMDKRHFCNVYFYLLRREHLILFTFFNWNDFNIFSIKLSKFFFSLCTDMAFNVIFFSDESMHKVYVSGGGYDFIGQLIQTIYSTIVSQVLQVFINFLSLTDILYYELKKLSKSKKLNTSKIYPIMRCIKIKLIIMYIFTFLFFLAYWYLISAFCAVYVNTQKIFIVDSISSCIMGLLYPFAWYIFPAVLRLISLSAKEQKNLNWLYILSDKIPIF